MFLTLGHLGGGYLREEGDINSTSAHFPHLTEGKPWHRTALCQRTNKCDRAGSQVDVMRRLKESRPKGSARNSYHTRWRVLRRVCGLLRKMLARYIPTTALLIRVFLVLDA